jgi:uncharacterized repeat protein (TIGR03803 family)
MSKFLLYIAPLAASSFVSAQTYTVLYNFDELSGPRNPGMIAQSRGGAMLSSSHDVDSDQVGDAFRIWPDGSLQVLPLAGGEADGGLILATDGKFYGTTKFGSTSESGTVFKMSPDGTVTTLHVFTGGSDGADPIAAPIQSVEGDFYGTTKYGSVYRITKYGDFTLLRTLTGTEGSVPEGPLVQGTDYYFYGTTAWGGQYGHGTIFRVSRSGNFKVLLNFDGAQGANPYAGLIQANDGNFYGVTQYGGSSDLGVLFRMRPDGTLTVLHGFTGGSDGGYPVGGLVQASDGNLYGTNTSGGKNGSGVIFRATLGGDLVPVHDFDGATGVGALSALFQHTNGRVYGDTSEGGTYGQGVFYSLDEGLPPFVSYLPTYGRVGALVQILGQGFTANSVVSFNGTPATFKEVYPTYIRATVPDGATSGPITVTTANGTLTSNKVFVVHQ